MEGLKQYLLPAAAAVVLLVLVLIRPDPEDAPSAAPDPAAGGPATKAGGPKASAGEPSQAAPEAAAHVEPPTPASTNPLTTRIDTALQERGPAGKLDRDFTRRLLREVLPPVVQACAQGEPGAATPQRLTVELSLVGAAGIGTVVKGVRVDEDAGASPTLTTCVVEALQSAQLEAPSADGTVTMSYPFVLDEAAP
ncbi:MAG: hypothetical protein AAF721_37440 [Myxococcota bacterium]